MAIGDVIGFRGPQVIQSIFLPPVAINHFFHLHFFSLWEAVTAGNLVQIYSTSAGFIFVPQFMHTRENGFANPFFIKVDLEQTGHGDLIHESAKGVTKKRPMNIKIIPLNTGESGKMADRANGEVINKMKPPMKYKRFLRN